MCLHRPFRNRRNLVPANKGCRLHTVAQSLARAQGDDDEKRKIDAETDHNAVGQAVFDAHAEHRVGMKEARHICRNRIRLQNGWQEKCVGPQRHADDQAGEHAGAPSAAPCHCADQTGRELRCRSKGQKPNLRKRLTCASLPIIGIGEQQQHNDDNTPCRDNAGASIATQTGEAA